MIPASKNLRYLRARSQVRGWEKAKRMVYTIKNYGPAKIPSICANIVDFNQVQTLTKHTIRTQNVQCKSQDITTTQLTQKMF